MRGWRVVMTRRGPETAAVPPGSAGSLRLLGAFELRVAGQARPAGPIESRILALAGIHGRPLTRKYVAATVWPLASPARAAARLRSALYRLHRMAPSLLRRGGEAGVGLAAGVACDARELERWARSVVTTDDGAGGTGPERTGVLLPEWGDPWVLLHRERLRQLELEALEVTSLRLSAEGRHDRAAAAGRAAVQLGPLRESARRVLIRALGAAGRHADAAREYADYRARLRRELGLAPSPHLDKVMASLGVLPSRDGDAPVTSQR